MTGKIYWIPAFAAMATESAKIRSTEIHDAVIDSSEISFETGDGKVKLLNKHGGSYKADDSGSDSENPLVIEASVYENANSYLLQGSWKERVGYFTWVARINKD